MTDPASCFGQVQGVHHEVTCRLKAYSDSFMISPVWHRFILLQNELFSQLQLLKS